MVLCLPVPTIRGQLPTRRLITDTHNSIRSIQFKVTTHILGTFILLVAGTRTASLTPISAVAAADTAVAAVDTALLDKYLSVSAPSQ